MGWDHVVWYMMWSKLLYFFNIIKHLTWSKFLHHLPPPPNKQKTDTVLGPRKILILNLQLGLSHPRALHTHTHTHTYFYLPSISLHVRCSMDYQGVLHTCVLCMVTKARLRVYFIFPRYWLFITLWPLWLADGRSELDHRWTAGVVGWGLVGTPDFMTR